jgi:hypothetical protein
MVWLRPPIDLGLERRIEMLPLHRADGTRHIAITRVREALQGCGNLDQEGIAAFPWERASGLEDGVELSIGERERHAADSAAGVSAYSRIRLSTMRRSVFAQRKTSVYLSLIRLQRAVLILAAASSKTSWARACLRRFFTAGLRSGRRRAA